MQFDRLKRRELITLLGSVRYRYYVSHATLQKRKAAAGSIARVPAPEIENLVLDASANTAHQWRRGTADRLG
jgi:hypothetical protein